nr:hypothetical protein [Pedobacter panaciterrae]
MNVLNLGSSQRIIYESIKIAALLIIMVLLWPFAQQMVFSFDETAGYIDPGNMVLLVLMSLITFVVIVVLSGWILKRFLAAQNLPGVGIMVLQFKKLELWQQLGFYWASFALLLLAAAMSVMAIC